MRTDASYSNRRRAFTLIELIAVIAIIIVLIGFVFSVSTTCGPTSSRDRVRSEIAAFETAMESYKADNGNYPHGSATSPAMSVTAQLSRTENDPLGNKTYSQKTTTAAYLNSSRALYAALSGDTDGIGSRDTAELENKVYFEFQTKKSMLSKETPKYIVDPWGNCYGYSTIVAEKIAATDPDPHKYGYNPTYDLWSTANQKTSGAQKPDPRKWETNW